MLPIRAAFGTPVPSVKYHIHVVGGHIKDPRARCVYCRHTNHSNVDRLQQHLSSRLESI